MKNALKTTPHQDLKVRKEMFNLLIPDKDLNDKIVLDVGCGFGAFLLYCLEKNSKKVCGIEISDADLENARSYLYNSKIELKKGSAIKIPYPDNYFDTVVSFEVLEHIPKNRENKMFSEINRVLKDNGVLYLTTPYNSLVSKYLDPAFYLIGHRHYSEKEIQNYSTSNGFEISKIKKIGTIWELLNLLILYISKWVLKRDKMFKEFIHKKVLQDLKNKEGFMNIYIKATKKSKN